MGGDSETLQNGSKWNQHERFGDVDVFFFFLWMVGTQVGCRYCLGFGVSHVHWGTVPDIKYMQHIIYTYCGHVDVDIYRNRN